MSRGSEEIEQLLGRLGAFFSGEGLGRIALKDSVEALGSSVRENLQKLRQARGGLADVNARDKFGDASSLKLERYEYQRVIAEVETRCEVALIPKARDLLRELHKQPDAEEFADQLAEILSSFEPAPSVPEPPEFPPRANGKPLGSGLYFLTDLTSDSQNRATVIAFRADFVMTHERVTVLADYKALHEQLHTLQMRCYNNLLAQGKRFPEQEDAEELLRDQESILYEVIVAARDIVQEPVFASDPSRREREDRWIRRLGEAQQLLSEALEQRDRARLRRLETRLNQILSTEPTRINILLAKEAREGVRLARLVEVLCAIRTELGKRLEVLKLERFDIEVETIRQRNSELQRLVNDHESWQQVDDEFRRIEAQFRNDLEGLKNDLEISWPDILQQFRPLQEGCVDEWSCRLDRTGHELDDALSRQDLASVNRLFRRCQQHTRTRFFEVDGQLKRFCYGLVEDLKTPLSAVIESLQ